MIVTMNTKANLEAMSTLLWNINKGSVIGTVRKLFPVYEHPTDKTKDAYMIVKADYMLEMKDENSAAQAKALLLAMDPNISEAEAQAKAEYLLANAPLPFGSLLPGIITRDDAFLEQEGYFD